jgi:hypothetical protein
MDAEAAVMAVKSSAVRSLCAGEILERYEFSGDFDQSGWPDAVDSDWAPLACPGPVTYRLSMNPSYTQSPVDHAIAACPIGLALNHPEYRLSRILVSISSSPEPALFTDFNHLLLS